MITINISELRYESPTLLEYLSQFLLQVANERREKLNSASRPIHTESAEIETHQEKENGRINPPSVDKNNYDDTDKDENNAEEIPVHSHLPIPPPLPFPPTQANLDIEGLPWDARIHARTKNKTKDGAWKLMRGADLPTVNRVKQELRKTMNAPALTIPVGDMGFQVPPPPPVIAPSVIPPPQETFSTLMFKIQKAIERKVLTHAQMNQIINHYGIPSAPLLNSRPDLIPVISQSIDAAIAQYGGA